MIMNCLEFALKFNSENPDYPIYYDGDHIINLHRSTPIPGCYLPLTDYDYSYIRNSFSVALSHEARELLERYYDNQYKYPRV